jgi:hypothetical protein
MPLDSTDWAEIEVDEVTTLLIRARGFIERGWCRYFYAKGRFGIPVSPTCRWAVSWCAVGAIRAAASNATTREVHEACARLAGAMGLIDIIVFNDRQKSVEEVLAAFDRAITAPAPRQTVRYGGAGFTEQSEIDLNQFLGMWPSLETSRRREICRSHTMPKLRPSRLKKPTLYSIIGRYGGAGAA